MGKRTKNVPFSKLDFCQGLGGGSACGQIASSAPLVDAAMLFTLNLASGTFTPDFRRGHRRKQATPSRAPSE